RFGKPERLLTCECERSEDTTVSQTLQLLTGELLNRLLSHPDNQIGKYLVAGRTNSEMMEELYLHALSRLPTAQEHQAACAYLERARDRRAAWEDVVWALLNAKEFLLRQ